MKSFLKNLLATILGIILSFIILMVLCIGIISIISMNSKKEIQIEPNTILKIDFKNPIVERKSTNPLDEISLTNSEQKKTIELKQVLDNIEKAKNDDNIQAIYLNASTINAGLSQTEEIRNKLLDFKSSGKKIIAYAEWYSQKSYYLSSLANKLYLNPEGIVELSGFSANIMFFKGLLEKLNIEMQIIRHGKFKSAVEPFIAESMSQENREQTKLYLSDLANNIFDSISSQRNLRLKDVEKYINQLALNTAENCKELGFVDDLMYEDQVETSLKSITETEELNFISLKKYSNVKSENKKKISRDKIAIIYATGEISSGKGDYDKIGSITTAKAIKNAREDEKVKAIVLRINSPGGSALASDVIWRETILTKGIKPIVVSMGDVAASGGYYIACAADSIVANPTTITGSIGVFGMIPNMQPFYKKTLGITIDTVNTHKYSDIGSFNRGLTNFEKAKIQESVEKIYDTFISNVAEGRKIAKEEIDQIGQGRVWSGYNAKQIGLIDVFGGLEKAIKIAADLAKLTNYRTISLPKEKNSFEEILKDISSKTSAQFILKNLGIHESDFEAIENLLDNDYIQARLPYLITLE